VNESQLIERFVYAWAKAEGFFEKRRIPAVSQRLNNPCGVPFWHDASRVPYPVAYGMVEFPDEAIGWEAAKKWVKINALTRGMTFLEFFGGKFLGKVDGKPKMYRGVCPRNENFDPHIFARCVAREFQAQGVHTPIASLITLGGVRRVA
jgi:hypothetical protein